MPEWRIPLCDLTYDADEEAAVLRVLRAKWLSMGSEVEAFERDFAESMGAKHAIAVANGTAALHLSYLALGIGEHDEIVQPAINFVAAANMTIAVRATPVFADILGVAEPTIDPDDIERKITPRTKAIVVMHYGGYPCRMAEIFALCHHYRLALVEDACHAVGARCIDARYPDQSERYAGALGDISCFSFFSNKNLATGEGGMVVTSRDDLADRVRRLRSHGMTTMTWDRYRGHASSYDVVVNGFNYRLDELRAALGRCQLEKLSRNNRRRKQLVAAYRETLAHVPRWSIPFRDYTGDSAYHLMVAVAPDEDSRSIVSRALKDVGIQTSLHYPCLTDFEVFSPYRAHLPTSKIFAARAISLPLFPDMNLEQVTEICATISQYTPKTASTI